MRPPSPVALAIKHSRPDSQSGAQRRAPTYFLFAQSSDPACPPGRLSSGAKRLLSSELVRFLTSPPAHWRKNGTDLAQTVDMFHRGPDERANGLSAGSGRINLERG